MAAESRSGAEVSGCLRLSPALPRADRPTGWDTDPSFSAEMVRVFVEAYSDIGDLVVDPFAGFGTTVLVAESLGRRAMGCELLEDLVAHIQARIGHGAQIHQHDARRISELTLPAPIKLVVTSPPYMTRHQHPQNPLTAYQTLDGDYGTYLSELQRTFEDIGRLMAPDGRLVLNLANFRTPESGFTPLAWDVGSRVAEVLDLRAEVTLSYDLAPGVTADYCFVFQPRQA